jgi:hypothetical protein
MKALTTRDLEGGFARYGVPAANQEEEARRVRVATALHREGWELLTGWPYHPARLGYAGDSTRTAALEGCLGGSARAPAPRDC